MKISEIHLNDLEEIKELQPENWSDILIPVKFYIESPFCSPIKITLNNKIIGIGASIMHKYSAWLAHIIVHPENRSKGIGGIIIEKLLADLKKTTCSTILLIATPIGEPLYKKYHFEKETDYLFFKNETYTIKTDDNNFITNCTNNNYNEVLLLDRKISGEDRSILLNSHLANAKLFMEHNKVTGFYIPTLGEGLVIAENDTIGIALLKLRLENKPIVVLPAENETGTNFLTDHNFHHFQTGIRMRLGEKIDFNGKKLFSRIGGNLG